jgi:hypothetical protein
MNNIIVVFIFLEFAFRCINHNLTICTSSAKPSARINDPVRARFKGMYVNRNEENERGLAFIFAEY